MFEVKTLSTLNEVMRSLEQPNVEHDLLILLITAINFPVSQVFVLRQFEHVRVVDMLQIILERERLLQEVEGVAQRRASHTTLKQLFVHVILACTEEVFVFVLDEKIFFNRAFLLSAIVDLIFRNKRLAYHVLPYIPVVPIFTSFAAFVDSRTGGQKPNSPAIRRNLRRRLVCAG